MISLYVVEDDQIDRLIIKKSIEPHFPNVKLHFFINGHELINHLESTEIKQFPSLILLDINTPQLNGIEFLELYAIHPKVRFIPKVVVSTSNNIQDIKECYSKGACGYFVKPVDNEKFNSFIKSFMDNLSQLESIEI